MIKVLSEITSSLNKDSLVVSIAAGITLDQLAARWAMTRKLSAPCRRTLRCWLMPMTSCTPNALVTPEDTADVLEYFPLLWRSGK